RPASWLFNLAHLEHRRNQIAAGRLSLHDRPTVSARSATRTDRLTHAVPLHLCGDDVWGPELDDLQRGGAVHSDARARLLCDPARHALLDDAVGGGNGGPRRGEFWLGHGRYFLPCLRPHYGVVA